MRACRGTTAVLGRVSVAALAAGLLALTGCGARERDGRPARLLDGSHPPRLPTVLRQEAGRGAVVSHVRVRRIAELDARGRACLVGFRPEFHIPARAFVVERIGVTAASLTFLEAARRVVLGCDRTGSALQDRPWCARSVGRLFSGRLRDPRVDVLCRGARGEPVGLGWIEPAAGVRWVVVRNGQEAEVEEVAGGLPVRVATTDVSTADSSATFAVTEYGRDGEEVRSYRLRAQVAG